MKTVLTRTEYSMVWNSLYSFNQNIVSSEYATKSKNTWPILLVKLLEVGPVFQIMKIKRLVFQDFQVVDSKSLGRSVCEHTVLVSCPGQSGHMTLQSGGSDGFAKSPTAPKAFPSTASKFTVPAIKVTCSSAWIIIVTSMSASGVYLLESQATEGFISTPHFKISTWNDTSCVP